MPTFAGCLVVGREQIMLVGGGLAAVWETKLFAQLRAFHFKLPGSVCPKHLQLSQELLITFCMVDSTNGRTTIAKQN